jgi:tetratricopeptide (TPR) repeat protein
MKPILYIFSLLIFLSCKNDKTTASYLGIVNIDISGKASALPHFEKGLLLLHSFEYEDAREAFVKAQEEDPQMAMAYWGEAMTYNHSLWAEQEYEDGVAALENLNNIDLEENTTELERDLIKAVKLLYQTNTEKTQRDIDYANFMESLSEKYPSNHEVAAFYALSLLGSIPDGRDDVLYGKGAKIAQGILEENPKHPGALHYLIHSYDDPDHASLALDAAHAYSKVAPDASHALHMPSHIFVAMGMWDEVIASNQNSYQASLNRMERKKLDHDARGYHAFHWLQYGYLQKENLENAKKMVHEINQYVSEQPSKRGRAHLVFLKGTYLVESDDWDSEIADIRVDVSDLNISVRSKYHFLDGMKAYKSGNTKQLDSILDLMENDYKRESFIVTNDQVKICSGVTRDEASKSDLVEAQIRRSQLLALRDLLDNNLVSAEEHFLNSITLEESISYSYGPPQIQKPTRELYADWLVSQNRMEDATSQYELTLKNAPKRLHALKGIEKSRS